MARFPINFDGQMECVPSWAIQATHCLLCDTGYQALEARVPGFQELERRIDLELNEQARQHLPV